MLKESQVLGDSTCDSYCKPKQESNPSCIDWDKFKVSSFRKKQWYDVYLPNWILRILNNKVQKHYFKEKSKFIEDWEREHPKKLNVSDTLVNSQSIFPVDPLAGLLSVYENIIYHTGGGLSGATGATIEYYRWPSGIKEQLEDEPLRVHKVTPIYLSDKFRPTLFFNDKLA